ncbi:MAG TPA: ketoacyl-ACP synthase III [Pyrinomonadaceae bacterium]|jgi:3-oxoacyl-[acyl-carrier-protein] synthase III|nr:ketoacyl-ACP synthase III [Pyrinomonadaceae bacterium]
MTYARIIGTGSYVPQKVLTNNELSLMIGEDIDEFVSNVIGIKERHICGVDESTADLAEAASKKALESAGITAGDLDLIILATDTPEHLSPATSVVVQDRMGAKNAGTFDVNCACAGFVTALDTASKFIIADPAYKNVLVIGAYAMSKYIDWHDKKTATIFADGAGAMVLQANDISPGFLGSKLLADGSFSDYMGIYAGGTRTPVTDDVLREGLWTKVRFARKYPPEVNIDGWPRIIGDVLAKCELAVNDISLFLFTQVNLSTIKEVMKILAVSMERTHTVMGKWGYTGSACIPMVLDDAVQERKLKPGDNLIMCASGGGLNMACVAFRW